MIFKHVIYKLRFEEIQNLPTAKGTTIALILELERFEKISESPVQGYINELRRIINWN